MSHHTPREYRHSIFTEPSTFGEAFRAAAVCLFWVVCIGTVLGVLWAGW